MSKVVDLKAKVKTKRRLSEATKYEFACSFAEFYKRRWRKTWKKEAVPGEEVRK